MKITCEHCSAQYHIPDEKVAGKAFKIRCKQCGQFIVIRGALASEGSGTIDGGTTVTEENNSTENNQSVSTGSLESEARWYAVLRQERVGPFSTEVVQAKLASGEMTPSTYVWKEGFTDWTEARLVPELQGIGAVTAGVRSVSTLEEQDLHTDWLLNEPKKNARNENSVLFSLGDIPPSGAAQATPPPRKEGSGLIDIRNLAAQTFAYTTTTPTQAASPVVPAFSHSPASVLIPTPPRSGMPRWVLGLLLGLGVLSLGLLSVVAWVETHPNPPLTPPVNNPSTAVPTVPSVPLGSPPVVAPSQPATPPVVSNGTLSPATTSGKPQEASSGPDKVFSVSPGRPEERAEAKDTAKGETPTRKEPKKYFPPLPELPTTPTGDNSAGKDAPKPTVPSPGPESAAKPASPAHSPGGETITKPAAPGGDVDLLDRATGSGPSAPNSKPKDDLDRLLDSPNGKSQKPVVSSEETLDDASAYRKANAVLNSARSQAQATCASKLPPDQLSKNIVFDVVINDHRSASISGGEGEAADCVRSVVQKLVFPQFSPGNKLSIKFPISLHR